MKADVKCFLSKGGGSKLLHVAKWRDSRGRWHAIKIPHRSDEYAKEREWLLGEVEARRLADVVLDDGPVRSGIW